MPKLSKPRKFKFVFLPHAIRRMAQKNLADALKINLQELRKKYEDSDFEEPEANTATEEVVEAVSETRPVRQRIVYRRVHRAYLRILLERAVGPTYTAMGEEELEKHCEGLLWRGALEVVSCRRREAEALRKVLQDMGLNEKVRPSLEEALSGYPGQDIRILTAARDRQVSEKGRQELARAMR